MATKSMVSGTPTIYLDGKWDPSRTKYKEFVKNKPAKSEDKNESKKDEDKKWTTSIIDFIEEFFDDIADFFTNLFK